MDLSTVISIIVGLGGLAYFFKRQSDKNKRDAIMGQTEGQDKILRENQEVAKQKAAMADATIRELAEEREKQRKEYESKSRSERADAWNKKND